MTNQISNRRFENIVSAHLDAAYNLARWMTRNDRDAEDVVQEACLRAFRFFDSFRGENERAWLLAIVRNTCYTWLEKNRQQELHVPYDEDVHGAGDDSVSGRSDGQNDLMDTLSSQRDANQLITQALERLPTAFREVLVLRELEDFAYKDIAAIAGIPLGTVMSRLARARKLLVKHVKQLTQEA